MFDQNLQDRNILHKPIDSGINLALKQWKPYYRPLPKLGKITQVFNTTITCTVCRGQKMTYVKLANGTADLIRCPACLGKGIIWNKDTKDSGELIVKD